MFFYKVNPAQLQIGKINEKQVMTVKRRQNWISLSQICIQILLATAKKRHWMKLSESEYPVSGKRFYIYEDCFTEPMIILAEGTS